MLSNIFSASKENGGVTMYGEAWEVLNKRPFSDAEKEAIGSAVVMGATEKYKEIYGERKSVCFHMKNGSRAFLPLSTRGKDLDVNTVVDVNSANIVELKRQGDTMLCVEF